MRDRRGWLLLLLLWVLASLATWAHHLLLLLVLVLVLRLHDHLVLLLPLHHHHLLLRLDLCWRRYIMLHHQSREMVPRPLLPCSWHRWGGTRNLLRLPVPWRWHMIGPLASARMLLWWGRHEAFPYHQVHQMVRLWLTATTIPLLLLLLLLLPVPTRRRLRLLHLLLLYHHRYQWISPPPSNLRWRRLRLRLLDPLSNWWCCTERHRCR